MFVSSTNLPLHTAHASSSHFSPLVLSSKKLYSSRLRRPFPSKSIVSNISNKAALKDEDGRIVSKDFHFLSHEVVSNGSAYSRLFCTHSTSVTHSFHKARCDRSTAFDRSYHACLGMRLTGTPWSEPALHPHLYTPVLLLQSFVVLPSSTCSLLWMGAASKLLIQAPLSIQTSALKEDRPVCKLLLKWYLSLLPVIFIQKLLITWKHWQLCYNKLLALALLGLVPKENTAALLWAAVWCHFKDRKTSESLKVRRMYRIKMREEQSSLE